MVDIKRYPDCPDCIKEFRIGPAPKVRSFIIHSDVVNTSPDGVYAEGIFIPGFRMDNVTVSRRLVLKPCGHDFYLDGDNSEAKNWIEEYRSMSSLKTVKFEIEWPKDKGTVPSVHTSLILMNHIIGTITGLRYDRGTDKTYLELSLRNTINHDE